MNNNCTLEDLKMLYLRMSLAYGQKFTSLHTDKKIIQLWYREWQEGLKGLKRNDVFKAFEELKKTLQWPPSIAEFRKYCEKEEGIPDAMECMRLAIRRDLSHPIVDQIYKMIGSWDMTHDTEKVLTKKFINAHREALENLRKQKQIEAQSHGSDTQSRRLTHNTTIRGTGVREIKDYLPF